MGSYLDLIRQAIVMDTETLGLSRGEGLRELAVYNLESRQGTEFLLTPNFVRVAPSDTREVTKLTTSTRDIHKLVTHAKWMQVYKDLMIIEGHVKPSATPEQVMRALEKAKPWLVRRMSTDPSLLDRVESSSERIARLKRMQELGNLNSFKTSVISPADLFKSGGALEDELRGSKIIWFANAPFDSKQIGAVLSGLAEEGVTSNLKAALQTSGPTADPYYVTGVEVNKARTRAQITGDWTGVWKAYLSDQPRSYEVSEIRGKPGTIVKKTVQEVAVRDIQDVLRAMMSYGQKLNLAPKGDVYWGTALDVMYRLMGSLDGDARALDVIESHRAMEDASIHSQVVLRKALDYTHTLQQVWENTAEGQRLVRQAVDSKSGHFFEAATLLARQQVLKEDIAEVSLINRLGRAHADILEKKSTWQVDGVRGVMGLTQETPEGKSVKLEITDPNKIRFSTLEEVGEFLKRQGRYGYENIIDQTIKDLKGLETTGSIETDKIAITQYLDKRTADLLDSRIRSKASLIASTFNENITNIRTVGTTPITLATKVASPKVAKGLALGFGAVTAFGAAWAFASDDDDSNESSRSSIVNYNYQEWLDYQQQFMGSGQVEEPTFNVYQQQFIGNNGEAVPNVFNNAVGKFFGQRSTENFHKNGMAHAGIAGRNRGIFTDFGSPYQGIFGSQIVFANQELLDEREKYLRAQYGAVHFDSQTGLFGMQGILARARHQGYSYISGGESVAKGYANLNGRNLMRINLGDGNWKISVDDADTILVKRAGLRGTVASIFGLNKGYSFRLSGIDAPEVEHKNELTGESLYHVPQPGGKAGAAGLQRLLADTKNLELVFNPNDTSYGRMLGVLFSGEKNLNYELVRRGHAAFLPYGKKENDMLDWTILADLQSKSHMAGRGMWQHPYWKAYYDVSQNSNESITFNTFTRLNKIAQSQSTMDTLSMMELAQQQGFYSNAMAQETARIGILTHVGPDRLSPHITGKTAAHYNSYLHEMKSDTINWMQTAGTGNVQNRFSARNGYGKLDKALVLDSMANTDSIWNKKRLSAFETYDQMTNDKRLRRYYKMMTGQQAINQNIFNSNIRHHEFQ